MSPELVLSNGLLWVYCQGVKNHVFSAGDWLGTYYVSPVYSLDKMIQILDRGNQASIYFSDNEIRTIQLNQNKLIEKNAKISDIIFEPAFSNSLYFRNWRALKPLSDPVIQPTGNSFTRKNYPVVYTIKASKEYQLIVEFDDYRKETPVLDAYTVWKKDRTNVSSELFQTTLFDQATRAAYKLRVYSPFGIVKIAGFPNFPSIFGRDFGISALGEIYIDPVGVREEIQAHLQLAGTKFDPISGEQIGRAVHEYLLDIESRNGLYSSFPNFYANDSNALLLVNIFRLARIQHDFTILKDHQKHLKRLWDHLLQLRSQDTGFIIYNFNSKFFIRHQTFRDSGDAIQHPDGSAVESPIAPLHDQLCFLSVLTELRMYQEAGYPSPVNLSPNALYDLISDFSNKLEQHYWMPDLNAYALALDGQGKQVKIVNSDVGLGLYYRLFRNDRVDELYTTLIDPERLLSPIGVRTISKEHKIYNSSSYLQGAVWPWQLAIILAGIPKYGLDQLPFLDRFYNLSLSGSLHEVYDADAVLHSSVSLKDGHSTCVEQRWSAAVPWLALIEGILGIDISYQTEQTEIMEMLSQLKDTSGYSISNLYIKGKRF